MSTSPHDEVEKLRDRLIERRRRAISEALRLEAQSDREFLEAAQNAAALQETIEVLGRVLNDEAEKTWGSGMT